jgi:hypothetical protein
MDARIALPGRNNVRKNATYGPLIQHVIRKHETTVIQNAYVATFSYA